MRNKYVHTHKQKHPCVHLFWDTLEQTNGSNSQAIWKAVLFSHLPTYNTAPTRVSAFLKAS